MRAGTPPMAGRGRKPAMADVVMARDAGLSADRRYRYWLSRTWGAERPVTFVMLNPSTADAAVDDPTIRRCVRFAREWGYGGLRVVNLYAYRASRPETLFQADDPVGPYNDDHLRSAFADGGLVVAAWGARARVERVRQVVSFAPVLTALAVTRSGQPGHPLYLPVTATPKRWPAANSA